MDSNWFEKFYKKGKKAQEEVDAQTYANKRTADEQAKLEMEKMRLLIEQLKQSNQWQTFGPDFGEPAEKPKRKKTLYPKKIFDYQEPDTPEFDENCTPECRPGEHKCGK